MLHRAAPEGAWQVWVRRGRGGSVAPGSGRVHLPPCGRTLDSAQGLTKECCLGHFLEPSAPVGPAPLRRLQGKENPAMW